MLIMKHHQHACSSHLPGSPSATHSWQCTAEHKPKYMRKYRYRQKQTRVQVNRCKRQQSKTSIPVPAVHLVVPLPAVAGDAQQGTSPVARFSHHADRDCRVKQLSSLSAVPGLCQAPAHSLTLVLNDKHSIV